MYDYIQISTINDFVFCPRSIYFHSIYYSFDSDNYKAKPQKTGTLKHAASDNATYSSRKRYLQGIEIFSHDVGLIGKIDIYDSEDRILIERKACIKKIYDGYRYQLYAQKICLEEMGYNVKTMILHSLCDNKKYPVAQNVQDIFDFREIVKKMRSFDILKSEHFIKKKKCAQCIYRELCQDKS